MPENTPLVKWPEEKKLTFLDVQDHGLFVWVRCPDMPCMRDGSRWISIANRAKGHGMLFAGNEEVRRIRFNPENKSPVFEVI